MSELLDRAWGFWLGDVLKPLVVVIAAALHLAFLFAAWLALAGVRDFGRLEEFCRHWQPVKPEIFSLEETEEK
jgi:hypothetical protein